MPIVAMALALSGCTAMFNSSAYGTSDLYRTNNRAEVALQLKAKAEAEREVILRVLHKFKGNKTQAAKYLDIARPLLYQKIRRLNIDE